MIETVKVPIKMEYEQALASKADVDFILKECGGARAIGKVRMFLLEVLRSLEGL